MPKDIRIFLVDDHILVRDGIKALLDGLNHFKVINEASDGAEALEMLKEEHVDLLIADIRMPNMNGIELVKQLKQQNNRIKTLMLSMHDSEEYVVQSLEAGADGYLLKGSSKEEFLRALDKIMDGEKYFSGDISTILINHFSGETPKNTSASKTQQENPFNLTNRESQILQLVLQGLSNKEIGEKLDISKRTAEVHRFNLMKKMDVSNLIELTNKARKYKLDAHES